MILEFYPDKPEFSRWERMLSVVFSPETLTLATLNKSISKHGPFILQTLLTCHMLRIRHDLGPGGSSQPMEST